MKLKIEIEMDNDAFVNYRAGETARILRVLVDKIMEEGIGDGYEWNLRDHNGNRVGKAQVKGK